MISEVNADYWACFNALPKEIQRRTELAYALWRDNPHHPSLQFMRKADVWSVRITDNYRGLGRLRDDTMIWFFVGNHAEYLRVLRSR